VWKRRSASTNGDLRTVDVSLVDPLQAGDEVLLHAGVAIARLDPPTDDPAR
jgi:hydrogenase maturation factor